MTTKQMQYSKETLAVAMEKVRSGRMSGHKAANVYNIPKKKQFTTRSSISSLKLMVDLQRSFRDVGLADRFVEFLKL
jgi:helix-turn-helix, Psq domain